MTSPLRLEATVLRLKVAGRPRRLRTRLGRPLSGSAQLGTAGTAGEGRTRGHGSLSRPAGSSAPSLMNHRSAFVRLLLLPRLVGRLGSSAAQHGKRVEHVLHALAFRRQFTVVPSRGHGNSLSSHSSIGKSRGKANGCAWNRTQRASAGRVFGPRERNASPRCDPRMRDSRARSGCRRAGGRARAGPGLLPSGSGS